MRNCVCNIIQRTARIDLYVTDIAQILLSCILISVHRIDVITNIYSHHMLNLSNINCYPMLNLSNINCYPMLNLSNIYCYPMLNLSNINCYPMANLSYTYFHPILNLNQYQLLSVYDQILPIAIVILCEIIARLHPNNHTPPSTRPFWMWMPQLSLRLGEGIPYATSTTLKLIAYHYNQEHQYLEQSDDSVR